MKATVETNPLHVSWAEYEESEVKEPLIYAVGKKNFPVLAKLMMRSSNHLYAMCLGTYPPIVYLNNKSMNIINAIHDMNVEDPQAAYTFDAGPNPVIFTLRKYQKEVLNILGEEIGDGKAHYSSIGCGTHYSDKHLF